MDPINLKPKLSMLSNPKQFRETCMPQEFLIPMPIMKYIWTNPSSPKMYQKLIQCCKILFIKNPLLVIRTLFYRCYDKKGWYYCNISNCDTCLYRHDEIDMDDIAVKIWVTNFRIVNKGGLSNQITVLRKLFRQKIDKLFIENEKLSYNELIILSMGVMECRIYSDVRYENGELAPLEKIIGIFSKNTKVYINTGNRNLIAFKNYDDFLEACSTVKEVDLREVPNNFDVSEFYRHLKNKKSRAVIKIFLRRADDNEIVKVVDEILNTELFDFVPPLIYDYAGIICSTLQKIRQIHEKVAQKYHV